jgi:hypothetical protein
LGRAIVGNHLRRFWPELGWLKQSTTQNHLSSGLVHKVDWHFDTASPGSLFSIKELSMSHTALKPEIRDIQERLQRVSSGKYADQLLQIINRSGWTDTQAHLVRVILDSAVHQLEGLEKMQRSLVEAADEIGKAEEVHR